MAENTEHSGNGRSALPESVVQIVLTYDRMTGVCEIGSSEKNIEIILAVLTAASRQADVSYRVAAGIAAQQQIKEHNANIALAESLRMGKR